MEELGNLDSDITVSNIVKTANLSNGDLLYVFSGGKYQSYTLTTAAGGAKYWDRTLDYVVGANGQLTTDDTPVANIATLASGSGIWLVRPNGWDGANFTFYIYGKPSGVTSVNVAAGATALVGNPTQTDKAPEQIPVRRAYKNFHVLPPISAGAVPQLQFSVPEKSPRRAR